MEGISLIRRNWPVKLGALVLGLALWMHVKTNQSYDRILQVPLDVSEVSDRFVVANETPDFVNVRVHGSGKDLLFLEGQGRLELKLDVNQREILTVEPRRQDIKGIGAGNAVEVVRIESPRSLVLDFDYLDTREVQVFPRVAIKLAPGFTQVGDVACSPLNVRVSGPRRYVRDVTSVVTDSVRMTDVDGDVDMQVTVKPPDGIGMVVTPQRVRVQATVQPLLERRLEEVPIEIIRAPRGVDASTAPETVTVDLIGGSGVVSDVTLADVSVTLNYRARYEVGLDDIPLEVEVPENVELVRVIPPTASLVIRERRR